MTRIVLSSLLAGALAPVLLTACGEAAAPTAVATAPIRVVNGARTAELAYNALASGKAANAALAALPLDSATFGPGGEPALALPLHDPAARVFLTYVTQCALKPGQHVTWQDPFDGVVYDFPGEVGLCPSWAYGAPSPECLEATSACVLARNNAYGARVEVELRGLAPEHGDALAVDGPPGAYPIAEGAFFGTIFDAASLPVDVVVEPKKGELVGVPEPGQEPEVVWPRMYACSGPAWATAAAYTRLRVCASGRRDVSCLARWAGPCDGDPGWRAVCASREDKTGWGDCVGPDGQPWAWPLTTLLDAPGAVVDDQGVTRLRDGKR
jgi:hypothetical protein